MQSSYKIIKNRNLNIWDEKEIPIKDNSMLDGIIGKSTQAESLLKIANEEANKLINNVDDVKNEMYLLVKKEAQMESEDEKAIAYQEGFEKGRLEGFKKGFNSGLEKVKNDYQSKLDEASVEYESAVRQSNDIISQTNEKIIELSSKIANQIIKKSMDIDDSIIIGIAKSVISKVLNAEYIKITVCIEDKIILDKKIKELKEICPNAYLLILGDSFLDKGDCRVETESQILDATIDLQLENLKKALIEVKSKSEK